MPFTPMPPMPPIADDITSQFPAGVDEVLCLLDDAGKLLAVSAGFTATLGWTGDELRARALADIVHPEDRAEVTAALAALDAWVGAGSAEARVHGKDGSARWLAWTFARPPGGAGVRARAADLSPRRQRELTLSRFFDLSLEILCIWRGGKFYEVNPAFARMLGMTRAELLHTPINELIHPDDLAPTQALAGRLRSDGRVEQFDNRYRTRDGSYKWITWSFTVDPGDGAIYATGRDVSHLKEVLDELRAAKELSEQAMATAEAASRARNMFLANMSHELRTPLNGVLGYAQLLALDADLSDKQREGIDAIRRSGEHLLVLINDMLDLAKMEAGTLPTQATDIHLADFLGNVASIFEARARSKRIGFAHEALTELPQVIRCDETRLRQVLVNLLGHAIRGREHGGVFLGVGFANGVLRFRIEEAAGGTSSADREAFFEPLRQQGDPGDGVAGTVLDLPARLLQLVGGRLVIERGEGGSVYWVEIRPEVLNGWTPPAPAPRVIEGYEGARRTLLVADDKLENRGVLIHLLEPLGFDILEATDGEQALHLAQERQPDLILMDLVMPVLDGFEATRRLRAGTRGRSIPVIAMSASAFDPDRDRSRQAGCDGFVPKPVRRETLLALLERHLGLTWRYRQPTLEPPPPAPAPDAVASASVPGAVAPATGAPVSLSLVQLQAIYDAASIGDIRAILTIVESARKIEAEGARVAPPELVEEIHRLAKRFQSRKIKERIEPFLGRS
jgi:PAS domain S-box-containing protein